MTRKLFLFLALLFLPLSAYATLETFNSRIGPQWPTNAHYDRLGPLVVGGGDFVWGNPVFGNNTLYGTLGPWVDEWGAVRFTCPSCGWLTMEFDQPVQALSFQAVSFYPGMWTIETHPGGQKFTVPQMIAGQTLNITVPSQLRGFTFVAVFGPSVPLAGAPPGAETHSYFIDNVDYTFNPPLRMVSGLGIDPNSASSRTEKLLSNNMSFRYPYGWPFYTKLQQQQANGQWQDIEASYTVIETQPVSPSQTNPRLWPSKHLFPYGNAPGFYKIFQTVHMGKATLRVFPKNSAYPTFDVLIDIVRPVALGSQFNQWDGYIIDMAEESGIPPQYLKAQVHTESTFDGMSYRYEPITVDQRYMHYTYPRRGTPWTNYMLRDAEPGRAYPEGHLLCPSAPFTNGAPTHDCAFGDINDLSPRNKYSYCIGNQCQKLNDRAGWDTPITIRQIVNANPGMASRDPAPQYGATLSGTAVTASGKKRRACCTSPPPAPDPLAVTAQTPLAASYGLMHMIAAFAPDGPFNWGGVNNRHNPSLLMDGISGNRTRRSASLILGARKDVQGYLRDTRRSADDTSFSSFAEFEVAMAALINSYNPGAYKYVESVFSHVPFYYGLAPGSFPAVVCTAPVISEQTSSVSIPAGDSAVLAVKINSTYQPEKFSWYRGPAGDKSSPISGGTAHLSVSSPGQYWVEVVTQCGFTNSSTMTVSTASRCTNFPSISQQPAGTRVEYGGSATLRVAANNATSYQWYRGSGAPFQNGLGDQSSPITGANGPELRLENLTETASYWVKISNSCSIIGSQSARVEVDPCVRASVSLGASGTSITAGQTVTLTATASGTLPISFKWYADNVEMAGKTGNSITVTPTATTTYAVKATNVCGVDTSSVTINVCTPPSIGAHPQSKSITAGQSTELSVSATGTSPLSYQWRAGGSPVGTNSPTLTVSPTSTTTYSVVVTNSCGSATSNAATITVCNPPSITTQPSGSSITAGQPANLTVAASGSTPLTYQWFTSAGTQVGTGASINVTPTSTTTYFARVSNSCGSVDSASVTVTVCNPPSISAQPSGSTVTAGQPASLSVSANGTAPLTYQWFTSAGTQVGTGASINITPTATTTYFARVSNSCGTVDSAAVTVTVCNPPSISAQPSGSSITAGQPATLTVAASGSTPLTYQWFTSAGTQVGTGASINVTPAATTSYFARVSNSCGTVNSATVTVTVCNPPSISAQPSGSSIIAGQNANLSVSANGTAPLSYQWFTSSGTPAGTGASITVTPAVTTTYFARVSNGCGSVDSAAVTVTVTAACIAPSIVTEPSGSTILAGQNANLSVSANGTAPLSYQWFTSSGTLVGTGASITVTPAATTSYFARVSNSCGAADSSTVTVTVNACNAPSITTQPINATVAAGQPATLTVSATGTAPLSYQWFTSAGSLVGTGPTLTVSPTATTSYFARVSNTCGATDSATATVTVCTAPSITTQPASKTITAGQSTTLTVAAGGSTPLTYQWFTSAGSPVGTGATITVSPAATTTYFARVSNACGSVDSSSATVTVNAACTAPTIVTQPAGTSITAGQVATLTVSATGTAPLSYQWFNTSGTLLGTNASLSVSPAATTSYFVRVSNACGAADSATVTVSVCTVPSITTQPASKTITAGQSTTLTVAASGSAPLSYQWFTSTGTPAGTGASITVSPTATTTYFARVSNSCGSVDSAIATVTVNQPCTAPSIVTQPASASIVAGQTATLTVSATGTGPLSYQWFTSAGTPLGTNATQTVTPTTTTSYYVRVTNACGTVNSATATITVTQPCTAPSITAQPSGKTIYAGQTATLTVSASGTAPLSYQWFNSAGTPVGTGTSITVSPASTTSYFARVANSCGSADSATVTVTVNSCTAPRITRQPESTLTMAGYNAEFSVQASGTALTYQWYVADTNQAIPGATSANLEYRVYEQTSFYVIVTGACGSERSDTVTAILCTLPVITRHPEDITINKGESFTLTAEVTGEGPFTYVWLYGYPQNAVPGANGPTLTLTPERSELYQLRVTNACGAVYTKAVTVTVYEPCVPPAITVQPQNVTSTAGQRVTLSLTATGSQLRRYEWFQGSLGDTSTLVLIYHGGDSSSVNVSPTQTTKYWARVSNACGLVETNEVTVTIVP